MLLKAAASSFSLSNMNGDHLGSPFPCFSPFNSSAYLSSSLPFSPVKNASSSVVCASKSGNSRPLSGVVFEPFEEVEKEMSPVPNAPHVSLARQNFLDEFEAAINEQIKFFRVSNEEERDHAEKLMEYENKRGGRVKLQSIVMPLSEFDHDEKGDALVASKNNDAQLEDFVEREFLSEQVEAIKRMSEYVAQLRREGKGHGVWHFDQMLLHEGAAHGVAA